MIFALRPINQALTARERLFASALFKSFFSFQFAIERFFHILSRNDYPLISSFQQHFLNDANVLLL